MPRSRDEKRSLAPPTFVRPCERSIGVGTSSLDWISRAGRPIYTAHVCTRYTYRTHTIHRDSRGGDIEVRQREDRETAGWMAGSVSNYRLLITPPDPPIRRFTQEQSPTGAPRKVDLLTSARNDSINNASSAIALNTYPV